MKTYLKDDTVSIKELSPEMFFASMTIRDALSFFDVEFVITSGSEKETIHKGNSKHYAGDAIDFRSRDFETTSDKQMFMSMVKHRLGRDYDLILESDHFHCEWDAKEDRL
jgi:hypothetical protein